MGDLGRAARARPFSFIQSGTPKDASKAIPRHWNIPAVEPASPPLAGLLLIIMTAVMHVLYATSASAASLSI